MNIVVVFIWSLCQLVYAESSLWFLGYMLQVDPDIILELEVFDCHLVCDLLSFLCVYWYVSKDRLLDHIGTIISIMVESDLIREHNNEFSSEPCHDFSFWFTSDAKVTVTLHKLNLELLGYVRIVVTLDLNVLINAFELWFEIFNVSPWALNYRPKILFVFLISQTKLIFRTLMCL